MVAQEAEQDLLLSSGSGSMEMIGGVFAEGSLLEDIQDQLAEYRTPKSTTSDRAEAGTLSIGASAGAGLAAVRLEESEVSRGEARRVSKAIDAAREFFYMLVQTIIIGRTHPSKIALEESEKEAHKELHERFKTAGALAEASGAYGEPHLYGLFKQATEGPCTTEKPSVFAQALSCACVYTCVCVCVCVCVFFFGTATLCLKPQTDGRPVAGSGTRGWSAGRWGSLPPCVPTWTWWPS